MTQARLSLIFGALLAASVLLASGGAATASSWNSSGGPYRNGLVAFVRCCGTADIQVIRPDGSGERSIYRSRYDDAPLDPAWSPDGTRIAFVPGASRKRVWAIDFRLFTVFFVVPGALLVLLAGAGGLFVKAQRSSPGLLTEFPHLA